MTADLATGSISTILFDADGVLQSTAPGWREAMVSFLGPRAAADGDSFLYEVFVTERPTMTGQTDFGRALEPVLRRYGIDAAVADVLAPSTWIVPDKTMVDAVLALRASGLRCCLATNQQHLRAAYMRSQLGYDDIFDQQFYSCELGLAKPDPAYFSTILGQLEAAPDTVLFVDDKEENVAGARTAGLRAELFPRDAGGSSLEAILLGHGIAVA